MTVLWTFYAVPEKGLRQVVESINEIVASGDLDRWRKVYACLASTYPRNWGKTTSRPRGKSTFGRHLAREHSFAHYDLECHPRGWPHPELKAIWETSRQAFVAQLKQRHKRVALDWGFPVHCLPFVEELRGQGVRLIWFDGDRGRARSVFQERGGLALSAFDAQVAAIGAAGYPTPLNCVVVQALSSNGVFMDSRTIDRKVFA